jgi:hypothetical protein
MTMRTTVGSSMLIVGFLVACATATQTPATLSQAQAMYAVLQAQHADQRIEGDMIRARASIDTAQTAVMTGQDQLYADAIADVALRTVQTARAHYDRSTAQAQADSVQKLRLTRELALSQARQAELQRQTTEANARADSLERAQATPSADSVARVLPDSVRRP